MAFSHICYHRIIIKALNNSNNVVATTLPTYFIFRISRVCSSKPVDLRDEHSSPRILQLWPRSRRYSSSTRTGRETCQCRNSLTQMRWLEFTDENQKQLSNYFIFEWHLLFQSTTKKLSFIFWMPMSWKIVTTTEVNGSRKYLKKFFGSDKENSIQR